jgi:hypothetical protein
MLALTLDRPIPNTPFKPAWAGLIQKLSKHRAGVAAAPSPAVP